MPQPTNGVARQAGMGKSLAGGGTLFLSILFTCYTIVHTMPNDIRLGRRDGTVRTLAHERDGLGTRRWRRLVGGIMSITTSGPWLRCLGSKYYELLIDNNACIAKPDWMMGWKNGSDRSTAHREKQQPTQTGGVALLRKCFAGVVSQVPRQPDINVEMGHFSERPATTRALVQLPAARRGLAGRLKFNPSRPATTISQTDISFLHFT